MMKKEVIGWNEIKKSMTTTIEHLAVLRREATLLGIDKEEVDGLIYSEAKGQFDKFDDMGEERLMLFMLGDMLTNAPRELLDELFEDLNDFGGELNG